MQFLNFLCKMKNSLFFFLFFFFFLRGGGGGRGVDFHENAKNNSKPSKSKTILFRLNGNCKKTIRNGFPVQRDLFTKIYIL